MYAVNEVAGRVQLWDELKVRYDLFESPWVVLGDFNYMLDESDHGPERIHREGAFDELVNIMDDCLLSDLEFSGIRNTWTNFRDGGYRISEKLDRVLVNDAWIDAFPSARALFDSSNVSYHSPTRVFLCEV